MVQNAAKVSFEPTLTDAVALPKLAIDINISENLKCGGIPKVTINIRNTCAAIIVGYLCLATTAFAQSCICYGETHNGRLENGTQLIADPARYYCDVCVAIGRVYAHTPVAETVTAAYQSMAVDFPDTDFVLGEIGW